MAGRQGSPRIIDLTSDQGDDRVAAQGSRAQESRMAAAVLVSGNQEPAPAPSQASQQVSVPARAQAAAGAGRVGSSGRPSAPALPPAQVPVMPQGNGAAAIPLQPLYQLIQDVHKETVKMNQNMHVLSNKMERMEERMDQMQTSVDQKLTAISKHLQEDKPNMARTDARLDQEVKDRTEKDAELDSRMKEIEAVLVISKMADDVKRKKTGQ